MDKETRDRESRYISQFKTSEFKSSKQNETGQKGKNLSLIAAGIALAILLGAIISSIFPPAKNETPVANHTKQIDPAVAEPPTILPILKEGPLWEASGWLACVSEYKKIFNKKTEEPHWYRYANGICAEELSLPPGTLYLMILGPDRGIRDRSGFEITLEISGSSSSKTICSNRADYYSESFEQEMRSNRRCNDFPNLLSEYLTLSSKMDHSTKSIKSATKPNQPRPLNGHVECTVKYVNGHEKKYIIYKENTRAYAINGTARDLVGTAGLADGLNRFSRNEMQILLQQGLKECQ